VEKKTSPEKKIRKKKPLPDPAEDLFDRVENISTNLLPTSILSSSLHLSSSLFISLCLSVGICSSPERYVHPHSTQQVQQLPAPVTKLNTGLMVAIPKLKSKVKPARK
jgi:hypothetical protein